VTKARRRRRKSPVWAVPAAEVASLVAGELAEPQQILGPHRAVAEGRQGWIVRAFHPTARRAELLVSGGARVPMEEAGAPGFFAAFVPGDAAECPRYRLCLRAHDGHTWEQEDAYRFPSSVGEIDLHLLGEGKHRRLWDVLGAHSRRVDGVDGAAFAVWAPHAKRVSVVGDFCHWDGRLLPMRYRGGPGVFELFVPGAAPGHAYKYEIKTRDGGIRLKTDPFAFSMEAPSGTASRVAVSQHRWGDGAWLERRRRNDLHREPVAIYELHLGSWGRVPEEGHRPLTYREIAARLVEHVKRFGFTHIELLPVTEFPFDGSWGYQVSGYYAPTARFGGPDDFRAFVDCCHQGGVGVILDWVPAHFPRDDFALRRFDGEPLYEYADPRMGEHPDWGTLVFDFGRNEVRNFLVANALYWFEEFHIDGLRVDAVASMLYRDYGRKPGEWLPNLFGGRENLEAVEFLRALNSAVREQHPDCITIAEESTSWPRVTGVPEEGGLGFHFKWNMGWMNDTLVYLTRDPVHRPHHHDEWTFAAVYEYSEHFVMPLSHDEVVHGKRSLLEKMPGDRWQKFANLRLLLGYQYTRPGKKLLFMGTEIAPSREWDHRESLDWHLVDDPDRARLSHFLEALGRLYHAHPCLWRSDPDPDGFAWIDCSDRQHSVVSYRRRDGEDEMVVVLNATPVPRVDYRVGAPQPGRYELRLCSDDTAYGGSGFGVPDHAHAEDVPFHGFEQSLRLSLPPLSCLVLERER
jgi:1,4-alpha-glucan branching enzyme